MAAMQQAVQHGRGHHLVAQHRSPFLEPLIGRQDRRRPLVARVDQLEVQPSAVLGQRQVADLVHDQQRRLVIDAAVWAT